MRACVLVTTFFTGLSAATGGGLAYSQNYPTHPVRLLCSEPGGGQDFAARIIAQAMAGPLGQSMIVENQAGVRSVEAGARAQPDGYTVLLTGSNLWLLPFMRDDLSWDPLRDFAPLTLATRSPHILVVHPSVPTNDVKELIAYAKANPGKLNYGAGGSGTSSHLAAELFKTMAGIDIVRIIYKGNGLALNAQLAGEVQVAFATPGPVTQHIKAGRLKALAVTSPQPSPLLPGLPTIAESGLPGFDTGAINAIFAPGKTPAAIVRQLNQALVQVLKMQEVKDRFYNGGVEAVGTRPEDLAAAVKTDMAVMGKVIKDARIRAE